MKVALVVDDSAGMRRIEQRALEAGGWEVHSAASGVAALASLAKLERCDLLVTDWHMPELDGLELVRAVRAQPALAHLRILMVTSDGVMEAIERALAAGADDFIIKPFADAVLRDRAEDLSHGG